MPNQDEIMAQIVDLVRTGAGGELTSEAESALRARYYDWITRKKDGNSTSPQDIWDTDAGKAIKGQIEKIGQSLAETKQTKRAGKADFLGEAECLDACRRVEADSACPHCPDDPRG